MKIGEKIYTKEILKILKKKEKEKKELVTIIMREIFQMI